jgi:hypothetical protein
MAELVERDYDAGDIDHRQRLFDEQAATERQRLAQSMVVNASKVESEADVCTWVLHIFIDLLSRARSIAVGRAAKQLKRSTLADGESTNAKRMKIRTEDVQNVRVCVFCIQITCADYCDG